MLRALPALALACAALGCRAASAPADPGRDAGSSGGAAVAYRLQYDPRATAPLWRVELEAHGLAGASELVLELADWGEWLRLDDYYWRGVETDPPLARGERRNELVLRPSEGWDGTLRVSYELPVVELASRARESFGLLPFRAASYTLGYSDNTLAGLSGEGLPEGLERTVEIVGPEGWTIASGYAPPARGRLRARLEPGFGNTAIAIGRPVDEARAAVGDVAVHVVQLGGPAGRAEPLAQLAGRYLRACTRSLGAPPPRPITLIASEPGFGGTRLDGAIVVGCPSGFDPEQDAYTLHFLAHELFHDWLGGTLESAEGERMAWFWEGFTEYLSLWHLAREGIVSRAWFATRLLDYPADLAGNEHWGALAFADPSVDWRDPAIEPLAYQGSALLAFALDVELRRRGRTGLCELLRALLARDGGRYTLESIRSWLVDEGLEDFWAASFAGARRIDPVPDLVAVGFEPVDEPRSLAYVGLRLDQDGPFGTVVAVDPDGPSAGLVRVGDRVSGLTPTREAIEGAEQHAREYPFGVAYYQLAGQVRVDVERGGEHVELWVPPRAVDGPPRTVYRPGPGLDAFFRG